MPVEPHKGAMPNVRYDSKVAVSPMLGVVTEAPRQMTPFGELVVVQG